jgi:ectoine hydroxylase-related dioxygenase (phytanoyl-CoA dioxygenase family)
MINIKKLKEEGIVKIKNPKKIISLKRKFLEDSLLFFKNFDESKFTKKLTKDNFLNYLIKLRVRNRSLISTYYKVSRRFSSLRQLATCNYFIKLSKMAMKTKLVSICHFVAVRIDFFEEKKRGYLTEVHQDFPYIQGSLNGITIWTSLYDTISAPQYIPKSHKLGLLKYSEKNRNGTQTLKIDKKYRFKEKDFESIRLKDNESIIFNTLLIHKSAKKTEKNPRISIQLRYDDITNKNSFAKNYPDGLYLHEQFKKNFKEFII